MITSLFRRLSAFYVAVALVSPFFAHDAAAITFNTIHTFTPLAEGNVTYAPLVQGADGRLYGVNSTGGRSDNGTIFSLNTGGGNFLTLNTFTQSNQGTTPEGGIVQARDGNFYGTTSTGSTGGYGTLYQCIPSTGKLNIFTQFTNGNPGGTPLGTLTEGIDGYLYGTAEYGGGDNYGTVFRTDIATAITSTFAEITGGLAGQYPESDLIQATDGNFYGTTELGGTNNLGTFFQVTPAGVYTVIYSFTGAADGSHPVRGIIQGTDGSFYGVCNAGGTYGGGSIYKIDYINTTFLLTALHDFYPLLLDGSNPQGNLAQASDGNFYGTTTGGGVNGDGTVYEVTPTGGYNLIYSFTDGVDSQGPIAGLVQAADGKLYGTAAGLNGEDGTIFRLDLGLASPTPRPQYLLQTNASVGDTILIKGDHFVGATAVSFTAASGAPIASGNITVLSQTVVQAVVPTGAVTGPVYVTANGLSGVTPGSLNVAVVVAPTAPITTTVTAIIKAPLASRADGTKGKFKILRADGDTTKPLTVNYKIAPASTAILGTDYTLVTGSATLGSKGTVTIPVGATGIPIKVVPVQSTTTEPTTTVILKVMAGTGYNLGTPVRAQVLVTSNTAGQ